MSRRAWGIALATLLSFASTLALAQAPPDAAREANARAFFERGLAAAQQERWEDALALFQSSRELVDRPTTTLNIALVLLRLRRPSDALVACTELERQLPPTAVDDRAAVGRIRAEATRMLASLSLQVSPADARVTVDGRVRPETGARRELLVDPGEHVLEVSAPEHEAQRETLQLAPGERLTRSVELHRSAPPPTATLRVRAQPPGARVAIDAREPVEAPLEVELEAGAHTLVVEAPGHESLRQEIELAAGETRALDLALTAQADPFWSGPGPWVVAGSAAAVAAIVTVVAVVLASGSAAPNGGSLGIVFEVGP